MVRMRSKWSLRPTGGGGVGATGWSVAQTPPVVRPAQFGLPPTTPHPFPDAPRPARL